MIPLHVLSMKVVALASFVSYTKRHWPFRVWLLQYGECRWMWTFSLSQRGLSFVHPLEAQPILFERFHPHLQLHHLRLNQNMVVRYVLILKFKLICHSYTLWLELVFRVVCKVFDDFLGKLVVNADSDFWSAKLIPLIVEWNEGIAALSVNPKIFHKHTPGIPWNGTEMRKALISWDNGFHVQYSRLPIYGQIYMFY